jgi:TRAP-type C4-dicarboxylate transport system substrate-binding protein
MKLITCGRVFSAILGLVVMTAFAAAAELKLAHFMSPMHPMDRGIMTPLAERIAAETKGALTVKVYPAGELGAGPNQQYRRALTGIADIAFNLPQYTPAQFKRSVLLHTPGLFSEPEQATQAIWKNIEAVLPDYSEVKLLAFWTNNPSILFSREKPVRSLADIKGMKIRVPDPVSAEIVKAWGGIPVSLPATETYNAMSTGIVDAVMIDASAVISYKLHEVTKFVTLNTPGALSTFTLIMNKASWERLSPEHKALVERVTGQELSLRAAKVFKGAGDKGIDLLKTAKIEMITLDAGQLEPFRAAMKEPLEKFLKAEGQKGGFDGLALVRTISTN